MANDNQFARMDVEGVHAMTVSAQDMPQHQNTYTGHSSTHPDAVAINVPAISRDSARKHRAALASRKVNDHQQQVDTMRQRCHSIINSWEHMESDKDIALLALEALAEGKRL